MNYENIKYFEEIVKEINLCNLRGFTGIKCGDCLAKYLYDWYVEEATSLSTFRAGVYTFGRCFVNSHSYVLNGNGDILFYLSGILSNRQDVRQIFNNLSNLTENRMVICEEQKYIFDVRGICFLFMPFLWNTKLKKIIKNRAIRWNAIRVLLNGLISNDEIERIVRKTKITPVSLITYEDFTPESHILTQKFNELEKKTTVIAHGAYSVSINVKEKFKYIHSQTMIVYSPYQEYVFRKTGTFKGKVISIGMPQFIGKTQRKNRINKKTVGVFLTGGEIFRDSDEKLIEIAVFFCTLNNCDLIVKMHPGEKEELRQHYLKLIDDRCKSKVIISAESASDVEDQIDLMLCGIKDNTFTSCVSEGAFLGIPVYLISFGENTDIEQPIKDIIANDNNELQKLIEKNNDDVQKELRKYLCGEDDPAQKFKNYFDSL